MKRYLFCIFISEPKILENLLKTMRNYKFTRDWFSWNIPRWKETLSQLSNKKINVLEIGVFEGRSTTWILEELIKNPKSKVIGIDTFEEMFANHDSEPTFHENIKESGKENQIEIIKKKSFDALSKLNYEKEIRFDFIYVDGSHLSCDALSDIVLSWNLLKIGGIMIIDDYESDYYEEEYNNPRIAVDSFLRCYQCQIEIIYKRYQVAIRKVFKEFPKTKREDKKRID